MKVTLILLLASSFSGFAQTTAPSGPLNNQKVIALVQAGLAAAEVSRIISTALSVDFNLSPAFTDQLLKYGVSEETIKLMAAKEIGAAPSPVPARQSQPAATSFSPGGVTTVSLPTAVPDEVGVYFRRDEQWMQLPPEIVNWKTGGVVKNVTSLGIVKGDINGKLRSGGSHTHLPGPGVDLLVYAPEGTTVEEYQLIRLREHPDSREFRTVTGGIFHVSGGAERDTMDFESQPIARRTWTIHMVLGAGQYGLLPPGLYESRSAGAQLGKLYTFSVGN